MTTHKAIREALPELPEPDRTMWQHGQQIDHYTADQMRAYALQAVEAMRHVAMTPSEVTEAFDSELRASYTDFEAGIRYAEAHHHITQKEQG